MKYKTPRIIISKCIEHDHCRFDGSMISSDVVKNLKPFVVFLPLCPEMAIGLPSPRESLRLIKSNDTNLLVQNKSEKDVTKAMTSYIKNITIEIEAFEPEGFLLKSRSPSCGINDVKAYKSVGKSPCLNKSSKGLFGEGMMASFPTTIFEDEGRLTNFSIREHFYTVIFTMADFKELKINLSMKKLVEFQEKNKYLFMAYSQNQSKILGRLVANHKKLKIDEIIEAYESALFKLFAKKPTKGQNINVMLHIFGYFSNELNAQEKAYFLDALEDYRNNHIPGSTVITILYSWVLRFNEKYLEKQTVFHPFPKDLVHVTDSGKGI
jgi:uncharacterized protein YbgA (DUF1722 family)/uncharacterized protein YbbK (DUF523 family)